MRFVREKRKKNTKLLKICAAICVYSAVHSRKCVITVLFTPKLIVFYSNNVTILVSMMSVQVSIIF